jgi:hypothetical protein
MSLRSPKHRKRLLTTNYTIPLGVSSLSLTPPAFFSFTHGYTRLVAWDERRARRLSLEGERALRRLKIESQGAPNKSSARLEVLMIQKGAAYEARNIERYEAAIRAMVRLAQRV